ncbi:TerB N-terminal domain-containing protein [Pararobbsia silviterrae]|uniref:tellurite resistance TerB family protein n=1 Tax=Pararobbsia silviterrae TaxID=1792498 RepID=UPI001313F9B0|nr:TerB N-terminal domain-containing protein [Pararobbsia silviterrae]
MTALAPNALPTPGTMLRADGARWIARDRRVVVAGTTIEGGLFYLDDIGAPEPAALDSPVVVSALDIADVGAVARTDRETGPTAAWLDYKALSPAQRRVFIDWLASDRRAREIPTAYLNLYLYGLERRVLVDGAHGAIDAAEFDTLFGELRRLLTLSTDWAFLTHVENLIESATVLRAAPTRLYRTEPIVRTTRGYQVPFSVRVAFGQAAVDDAPVSAEWAYAWASLDSAITRKPPLSRIPETFRLLFTQRYRTRLHEGLRVAPNRTRLTFPETAFPALRERDVPESVGALPDLSAVTLPRARLQQLVNDCATALAPYGRYLARNPASNGTLDAALLLAPALWPESLRKPLDALVATTREGLELTRFGDLLATFRTPAGLSREKIVTFVGVLGQAGVGIEPDIRTGARTPRAEDRVALFAIDPATRLIDEDCAYLTAALMIDVAATLAMADGEATHPELTLMHHQIEHAMHLSPAQQQRLKARLAVQISAPQPLALLKKRLEPLSPDARHVLAAFLVQTANADGTVTPPEVRLLEKIYTMLDLDTRQLYSDLHQDASTSSPRGARSGMPAREGARDRTRDDRTRAPLTLDADRIAALQAETAHVSALLAQVFAQDADDLDTPALDDAPDTFVDTHAAIADSTASVSSAAASTDDLDTSDAVATSRAPDAPDTLEAADAPASIDAGSADRLGLDDAHLTFLRLLVTRPRWSREDLANAAADLDLLLDGAIEQVNEASLDHWDAPLTDGDDPVEINQELAQRLAA